jgi:hypothetical protein
MVRASHLRRPSAIRVSQFVFLSEKAVQNTRWASRRSSEPPEDPLQVLRRFPKGLVTQEVAAIMTQNNAEPDRAAAESALIELLGAGSVRRTPLGDDALWQTA